LGDLGIRLGADEHPEYLSERGREVFLGHFPSGTSFRCGNHFRQLILSGNFHKYNFGFEENFKRYGSMEPPIYDLGKITKVPLALFCGTGD
jgi:lysosomal acid lipase/cholesteryl ester hydrolase